MSISEASATPDAPKRDWKLIRAQYESGSDSIRKLAAKLSIPVSTMLKRSMREGWNQTRRMVMKTAARLESEIDRHRQQILRDELSPWIEERKSEIIKRGYDLSSIGLDRMERALKSKAKIDSKGESMNARALQLYVQTGRQSLGMNDGVTASGALNFNILCNQAAIVQAPADTLKSANPDA